MKTIEISTARKPLAEYAKELGDDIIVLTSQNRPVAAIVSLRRADKESIALSTNPDFMEIIERAREEFRSGKTISLDEIERDVLH